MISAKSECNVFTCNFGSYLIVVVTVVSFFGYINTYIE